MDNNSKDTKDEVEVKKDQARTKIKSRLFEISFITNADQKAQALSGIMELAEQLNLSGEFFNQFLNYISEIKSSNQNSLNIINESQRTAIEKEEEERVRFKHQMIKFSNYFEEGDLDEKRYSEIAEYIDKDENKKHIEKHTQRHLNRYHELKNKRTSTGLSSLEHKEKKEVKKIAHTGIKTHIVGKIREYGKSNGYSEEIMLKVTNDELKNINDLKIKSFTSLDQVMDNRHEILSNFSTQQNIESISNNLGNNIAPSIAHGKENDKKQKPHIEMRLNNKTQDIQAKSQKELQSIEVEKKIKTEESDVKPKKKRQNSWSDKADISTETINEDLDLNKSLSLIDKTTLKDIGKNLIDKGVEPREESTPKVTQHTAKTKDQIKLKKI